MGSFYGGGGGAPILLPLSGAYIYDYPGLAVSQATFGPGGMMLGPVWLSSPLSITRIGAEVTVASSDVGSLFRIGIYANGADNRPGSLLFDAGATGTGSVLLTSATVQEVTVAWTIPAGLTWWGGATQGNTASNPSMRCWNTGGGSNFVVALGTTKPAAGAGSTNAWLTTGATGVLPATAANDAGSTTIVPRLFVKVA